MQIVLEGSTCSGISQTSNLIHEVSIKYYYQLASSFRLFVESCSRSSYLVSINHSDLMEMSDSTVSVIWIPKNKCQERHYTTGSFFLYECSLR